MRTHSLQKSHRGFTLIELLVVIAIIAILAAILFPVFAQAKAAAKTSGTISNVRQAGLAVHMYANDYDDMTPSAFLCGQPSPADPIFCGGDWFSGQSDRFVVWSTLIWPYMKNGQVCLDSAASSAFAVVSPSPGSSNWGRYTSLSANRLGFFDWDSWASGSYVVNRGRNLSSQENLSTRAMFTTSRYPDFPTFGFFFFDHWQATEPTSTGFYTRIVRDSVKSHRDMIPTVRGDGSAKTIPWNAVKKKPGAQWWDFDTTYWGGVQNTPSE